MRKRAPYGALFFSNATRRYKKFLRLPNKAPKNRTVFAVFRFVLIMNTNRVTYLNKCVARENMCVSRAHEFANL
jgi:hypothetical protein